MLSFSKEGGSQYNIRHLRGLWTLFLCFLLNSINFLSFNLLHATSLFLYPLKTSENQMFSDVFRGYRKRPVARNRLGEPIFY